MPKPRTISKSIPPTTAAYEHVPPGSPAWVRLDNGWQNLDRSSLGLTPALGYETTIDLTGYTQQELTFFPTAQTIQEPAANISSIASVAGDYIEVLEIISQVPLDLTQISMDTVSTLWGQSDSPPGFPGAQGKMSDIIVGRYRTLVNNADFGSLSLYNAVKTVNFGSGEPTASNKLYVYVIYDHSANLQHDDTMTIPPRRFVMGGMTVEEEDLEYIMRLRRSFDDLAR